MRALVLLVLLAGCAGQQAASPPVLPPPKQLIEKLGQFTQADFVEADRLAIAHGDKAGAQCYEFLGPLVGQFQGAIPTFSPTPGVATLFETLRVGVRGQSGNGLIEDINLHCAALFVDAQVTLARLAALATGTVATGGTLAPFLPALGGAILP